MEQVCFKTVIDLILHVQAEAKELIMNSGLYSTYNMWFVINNNINKMNKYAHSVILLNAA